MAELSYKNDNDADERLNPSAALKSSEQQAGAHDSIPGYDRSADGLDDHPVSAGDTTDLQQAEPAAGTSSGYYNPGGSNKKSNKKSYFGRRSASGGIIALLLGGGVGILGIFSPFFGLLHIKEVISEKFDSMSSVVESRGVLILKKRMFNTSATCKIKVQCKFHGLTQRQYDRLNANGAKIVDGEGKALTKNALGRYTGGQKLILEDGTTVKASDYKKSLRSNKALRDVSKSVFAPRYSSWNDAVSKKIRAAKKLTTKPDWGDDEDKEKATRKSIHTATSGEGLNATADTNVPKDEKTGAPKDGSVIEGLGDATSEIQDEADTLSTAASKGEAISTLPSDTAGAANLSNSLKDSVKTKLFSFLNPTSAIVGACTTFQISSAIIIAAKTVALVSAMRYAAQFVSTADHIKATAVDNKEDELTSDDIEKSMTILERENDDGKAFGDSVGYQYAAYGTVPSTPIASSATGNDAIRTLQAATIGWATKYFPGGPFALRKVCHVATNPFVQGGLSLTSFIPGAGQALKASEGVAGAAARKTVLDFIKDKIETGIIKKNKAELSKGIAAILAGPAAIFLATYLVGKYAIPYLARVISGTTLTGDEDGVTAMDSVANGLDATNAQTALSRGLTPLSKTDVTAFNQFNESSFNQEIADSESGVNPFDIKNPDSKVSRTIGAMYPFLSKFNIGSMSKINTLPTSILSAFKPYTPVTSAADSNNGCDDDYINSQSLASSPFCNVRYGFNDVDMLNNEDPEDVVNWMLDHKQIDEDGVAVAGSDFETFKNTCVDNTENKTIIDPALTDDALNDTCFNNAKNKTEAIKMYRLYIIDYGTDAAMDYVQSDATAENQATGDGSSFTVATYNLLDGDAHASDSIDVAGAGCNTSDDKICINYRTDLQAKIILGQDTADKIPAFDIVGTQETGATQYKALKSRLSGYDSIPSSQADISRLQNSKNGKTAIFWNRSKFTKVTEGKTLNQGNVVDLVTNPWVELQNSTGQKVFVMSIHFPNESYYNKSLGDVGTLKRGIKLTLDWAKEKSKQGTVIFMGDLNDHTAQLTTYCGFTQSGDFQNTYDLAQKESPSKPCPNPSKFNVIDHIYVSTHSGLTGTWDNISKYSGEAVQKQHPTIFHASDHTPVYSTLTYPKQDSSVVKNPASSGGWGWPQTSGKLSNCWEKPGHAGIDIAVPDNTPVYAAKDGTVVNAGTDDDAGNYIMIGHGDGTWSNYQHNTTLLVKSGDKLKQGQQIALSGHTGFATGAHIHFGVTDAATLSSRHTGTNSLNPMKYLPPQPSGITGKCA